MADDNSTGKFQTGAGDVIEKDGSEHFNPFDAVGKWVSGTGHAIATGWHNITGNSEGAAKEWAETCNEFQKGTEEWDLVGEFNGTNGTIQEYNKAKAAERGEYEAKADGNVGLWGIGSGAIGGLAGYGISSLIANKFAGGNKFAEGAIKLVGTGAMIFAGAKLGDNIGKSLGAARDYTAKVNEREAGGKTVENKVSTGKAFVENMKDSSNRRYSAGTVDMTTGTVSDYEFE